MWSTITLNSIEWGFQRNIINKLPRALQRASLRFKKKHTHSKQEKYQFEIKYRFPYCHQTPTKDTPHDNFLQCT